MRAVSRPSCSVLALAAALAWPAAAQAQRSFQGDGQVMFGSATISQGDGTVVRVASPQTVINWTPNGEGDPAVFQPAGTTALFTTNAGSSLSDFAVLNRILPADNRAIQLNGSIVSRLQGAADVPAGTVYFYSPGGIVVGASAVIDVGSLGLTSADPWSGSGPWLSADRTVSFAASVPGKAVSVAPGAVLTSSGSPSSYTAIVAPVVSHEGDIRTSGAAALVSADAATITFSPDNLFTIQVRAPASAATGSLTVDGGRVGRAAAVDGGAAQRLYLVAIPRNTALTMVIGGAADLGFAPAASARVDGNAIILSAGRDIERGAVGGLSSGYVGNAVISDASFRNPTQMDVTGGANLLAITGDLAFSGDVSVRSGAVTLRAQNGHTLSVGGSLLADVRQRGGAANTTGFGGSIDVVAGRPKDLVNAGTISVAQATTLLADGIGADGGLGVGGSIGILAYGRGQLSLGDLSASADGLGGDGAVGGSGTGGSIRLGASGGKLSLRSAALRSDGIGGAGLSGDGGSGHGGSVTLEAAGGRLAISGDAALRADARGGTAAGGRGGAAGIGGPGTLALLVSGGGNLTAGNVAASATARGGAGSAGFGQSTSSGGFRVQLNGGSARVSQLRFTVSANGDAVGAAPDLLAINSGSAAVDGTLAFATTGSLGVSSNAGELSASALDLSARTFVAQPAAADPGRLSAQRWTIASSGDVILGGTLASANGFVIDAPGTVRLGPVSSSGGDVLLRAGGALAVGDVASSGRLLLSSGGSLAAANLSAGKALALLSDGPIVTGSLQVPGGTVLIGGNAMAARGGPLGSLDWAALLGTSPLASGGSLLVSGDLAGARLSATVGGDARLTGAVTGSERLGVVAGGLVTLDGTWAAPTIALASSDLALGPLASLTAAGDLRLLSINPTQLQIGDGLSGAGYGLSEAEFSRLKGGSIIITGRSDTSAEQAIQLGRLTLTGAQLGANGTLRIATDATGARAGIIGIAGVLNGTGVADTQSVVLEAARTELDAATGAINLTGVGNLPAGQLELRTDRLWAADPGILLKLRADPAYVGHERDLAAPTATPRPEGIIRAGTVRLIDARQILIQNSGTRAAPAGVTTSNGAFLSLTSSAGPIELLANGQIVGPGGTVTSGFAVQGALTATAGFSSLLFTPNSSINGCLVSALSCTPTNVIRDEDINLSSFRSLPDKLFGDEGSEDDGDDKKVKTSAITPAERLVDGKPLERQQPVEEPVSSGANPALTAGSAPGGGQR